MKQVTILMRALGFLIIAGCCQAKYLLIEIEDGEDVEYEDVLPNVPYDGLALKNPKSIL